jgi:peptidoglycan/xylan/chitin deacetylase (PgdA/CDA1 family)
MNRTGYILSSSLLNILTGNKLLSKQLRAKTRCGQSIFRFFQSELTSLIVLSIILFVATGLFSVDNFEGSVSIAILNLAQDSRIVRQEADRNLAVVQFWERHLRALGQRADVIGYPVSDRSLEKYEILVIPGTTSLTKVQTEIILRFVENGKALILCEAAGESISDEPFNRNNLANVLGLNYQKLPESAAETWKVMLETPGYLTSGIPRLKTLDVESRFGVSALTGQDQSGFWIDPNFRDDDFSYWEETAAIVKGYYGKGSFVWMGFTAASVGGDLPNSEAYYRLSENTFSWLLKRPVVEKNRWPNNHKGAATLSMDTETAFSNINRMLQVKELPTFTLFILTEPAAMYRELLRDLAEDERCEIAVHGDNHNVFSGQPHHKQLTRLAEIKDFFREEIGVDVVGFRPPEEAYDYYTIDTLIAEEFTYIFADDHPDRAEPKILRISQPKEKQHSRADYRYSSQEKFYSLVQFPMLNKDDIKLIMIPGRTEVQEIFDSYVKDIENIISREGLYMANFHTHVLVNPRNLPVLREVTQYLKNRNVWVPTVKQVAEWWRLWMNIDISLEEVQADTQRKRSVVVIENNNKQSITDFTFSFWLPYAARSLAVKELDTGRRIDNFRLEQNRISVVIPELKELSSNGFEITWQE